MIYLGTRDGDVGYFEEIGLSCPSNYNPPGHIIKQLALHPDDV